MVKLAGSNFPVIIVVALQAVLTQPPFMLVLVASDAGRGHAEIRLAEIFKLDTLTFTLRHVLCCMASITGQPSMPALERVSGLLVVKGFDVPFDQRKINSVVLGVTASAFLA